MDIYDDTKIENNEFFNVYISNYVQCASVDIYDDTDIENSELFSIYISSGSRTQVTERISRITIIENDGNYIITLIRSELSI